MIETSRGSVVAWECDENAHLNVQFYTARIAEATQAVGQSVFRRGVSAMIGVGSRRLNSMKSIA